MGVFDGLRRLRREAKGLHSFKAVPRRQRRIVFYSEGRGYWTYFESIYRALHVEYSEEILYVTSGEDDPILLNPPPGIKAFYVGEGSVRTLFFATLDADVVLMTMPDLQTLHIKRSPYPVRYVYLHHSIVSTHMVYRATAFDHFDAILCVGPHHINEIRERERMLGLPGKELVEHGYGRLDTIMTEGYPGPRSRSLDEPPQVLVAPTWGENGLLELYGPDVVQSLIDAGLKVVVRPHPRTRKLRPDVLDKLASQYEGERLLQIDEDGDARASLFSADVMVSDWSGAALEFGFGLERPVIFVDVARKVLNPDYTNLGLTPLEESVRHQIGLVLPVDRLAELGDTAKSMIIQPDNWQAKARRERERWIFNACRSGSVAAKYLVSLLK